MRSEAFLEADILKTLGKTLAHPSFVRSPKLADFLTYIVEKKLSGNCEAIKAYTIAIDVFGRSTDFDPQTDSIVRVQANRLRKVLFEIYNNDALGCDVYITLPTGRYVPAFVSKNIPKAIELTDNTTKTSNDEEEITKPKARDRDGKKRFSSLPPFASKVLLALCILFGVGYALWELDPFGQRLSSQFVIDRQQFSVKPTLIIRDFEDVSGVIQGDQPFGQFSRRLGAVLLDFESLDVRIEHPGEQEPRSYPDGRRVFVLGGVVNQGLNSVEMGAWVRRADTGEIIWRFQQIGSIQDPSQKTVIRNFVLQIAAEVGAVRGPVHRSAFSYWVHQEDGFPGTSDYPCLLLFSQSYNRSNLEALNRIKACFETYLVKYPLDIKSRTAISLLEVVETTSETAPGDDLSDMLFPQLMLGLEAVVTQQTSSFLREQYARMLAISKDYVNAKQEFIAAHNNNPANTDALMAHGLMQVLNGNWVDGLKMTGEALDLRSSAPPWYYIAGALNFLRLSQGDKAIENAIIFLPVDEELALTTIVAAAPGAARSDLVERYAGDLLALPQFQAQGILPRLSSRIHDEKLLTIIRIGLVRAGFTSEQLDHPYQID